MKQLLFIFFVTTSYAAQKELQLKQYNLPSLKFLSAQKVSSLYKPALLEYVLGTELARYVSSFDVGIYQKRPIVASKILIASSANGQLTASLLEDLRSYYPPLDIDYEDNESIALRAALKNAHVNAARVLLEAGADIKLHKYYGSSALALVIGQAHTRTNEMTEELIDLLLSHKASLYEQDLGKTPLEYAVSSNNTDLTTLLLFKGAAKKGIDSNLLIDPAQRNNITLLRLLYHYAKIQNNTIDLTVPLCAAITSKNLEVISFLVQYGADLNKADFFSITPLRMALRIRDMAIVRHLLKLGADPNGISKSYDSLPECTNLEYALQDYFFPAVSILLNYNAHVSLPILFKVLERYPDYFKSFFVQAKKNYSIDQMIDNNTPLLQRAIALKNKHAVTFLYEQGAPGVVFVNDFNHHINFCALNDALELLNGDFLDFLFEIYQDETKKSFASHVYSQFSHPLLVAARNKKNKHALRLLKDDWGYTREHCRDFFIYYILNPYSWQYCEAPEARELISLLLKKGACSTMKDYHAARQELIKSPFLNDDIQKMIIAYRPCMQIDAQSLAIRAYYDAYDNYKVVVPTSLSLVAAGLYYYFR